MTLVPISSLGDSPQPITGSDPLIGPIDDGTEGWLQTVTGAGGQTATRYTAVTDNGTDGHTTQTILGSVTPSGNHDLYFAIANAPGLTGQNELLVLNCASDDAGPVWRATNDLGTIKLAFFGATQIAQQAVISPPSGGAIIDTQARAAIVSILNVLGEAAGGFGFTA